MKTSTTWTPAEVQAWIDRHGGNVTKCAQRIGVTRTELQRWKRPPGAGASRSLPPRVQVSMELLDAHPEDPSEW